MWEYSGDVELPRITGGGPPPMITPGSLKLARPMTKEEQKMTPVEYITKWIETAYSSKDKLYKDKILIIHAYTGSGKSTAMPCLLYRDIISKTEEKSMVVTQPKVLTAQRLAIEQGESPHYPFLKFGENIGYITGESKIPPTSRINLTFVTVGILLNAFINGDDNLILNRYKIIQIDEVHERALDLDLLLMYVKYFIKRNYANPECPTFLLSSATFDTKKYAEYFEVDLTNILTVSGVTFPSTQNFLSTNSGNWMNSAMSFVKEVHLRYNDRTGRDILIFVHGAGEMKDLKRLLTKINEENIEKPFLVIMATGEDVKLETINIKLIYFDMNDIKLNEKFEFSPNGTLQAYRRIILSTNVAETGLSIPTLGYVIDNGFTKSKEFYHPYFISTLLTKPVSKANAVQRMGRVGRLFEGDSYMLYTENTFKSMQVQPHPSVYTDDITVFLLNVIAVNDDFNIESLDLLDSPPVDSIKTAFEQNYSMGYITDDPKMKLTFMGEIARRCARITPQNLKCIFSSIIHNVSIQDMLTILASLSLFAGKIGKNINRQIFSEVQPFSYEMYKFMTMCDLIDNLCIFNAVAAHMDDPFKYCEQNSINFNGFLSIVETRCIYMEELYGLGIDPRYNEEYQLSHANEATFLETVKNIKLALCEGYRYNIITLDEINNKYVTRHNISTYLKLNSSFPCLPKDVLDKLLSFQSGRNMQKPKYLLAMSPEITSGFAPTYRYSIEVTRMSVLDGYVPIDDGLFQPQF